MKLTIKAIKPLFLSFLILISFFSFFKFNYIVKATSPTNLAEWIDSFISNSSCTDWTNDYGYYGPYLGYSFNKINLSQLEWYVDSIPNVDWYYKAELMSAIKRYNYFNTTTIEWMLDNIDMTSEGSLPITYAATSVFSTYDRWIFDFYNWSDVLDYQESKWNITKAYDTMRYILYNCSTDPTVTYKADHVIPFNYTGLNIRYYDECAQSIDCFLRFYYMFNITEALTCAEDIWIWINNNLWNDSTGHFTYNLAGGNDRYECEAGGFLQIITKLYYYDPYIGNISRLVEDTYNRFLISKWGSPQWTHGSTEYYVVLHEHFSNDERRLGNTLMAWFSMLGMYSLFNSTLRTLMTDMITGYIGYDPAWKLLVNSTHNLYDSMWNMFKITTLHAIGKIPTGYGASLMFMLGMIPSTATLAVPISEETFYETAFTMIDHDLFSFDFDTKSIIVSVVNSGEIDFQYGTSTVVVTFPSSGVYNVTFASDWNSLSSLVRVNNLPTNRLYMNRGFSASINPYSTSVEINNTVNFTSSVFGSYPPYTYQWYLNNVSQSGANSSIWSYNFTSLGTYEVNVNVTDYYGYNIYSDTSYVYVFSTYVTPSLTYNPFKDAFITPIGGNIYRGDYSYLEVGSSTGTYVRTVLEFNLTNIPTNAVLVNATLQLYAYAYEGVSGGGDDLFYGNSSAIDTLVYRLTENDWIDSEVLWSYKYDLVSWEVDGGNFTTPLTTGVTVGTTLETWYNWTVTNQVNDAISNRSNLLNILIKSTDVLYNSSIVFYSMDSTNSTYRPRLTLFYVVPHTVESWLGNLIPKSFNLVEPWSGKVIGLGRYLVEVWISGTMNIVNDFSSNFGLFGLLFIFVSFPSIAIGAKKRNKYVLLFGIIALTIAVAMLAFYGYMVYETWIG